MFAHNKTQHRQKHTHTHSERERETERQTETELKQRHIEGRKEIVTQNTGIEFFHVSSS